MLQCEFAGEVVRYEDAKKRWETYSKTETSPVILCLTSRLFVDATIRGNVSRYVRQSCRPNARLEVWSVNGNYRAGLFSLGEITSGSKHNPVDMKASLTARLLLQVICQSTKNVSFAKITCFEFSNAAQSAISEQALHW
ncbi:hypothetical protein COOONC_06336 [Cooperia oncophora]